ncbi:MAG: MurR/RpiR family transcriptional regulator [Corynebacterium sp.]|uniref:MurR/RpiR family transcriptional regulator n=1 Tax=Corynebacterium sp. TaxID=1720 RepID=UPI00179F0E42|nr:MurR/RpiR family transcriptional regulator [Corynebacterium sp.]NWO16711.1 MurR/RpiR family transcriptional regulator [Corynebacterium sp.]
MKSVDQWISGLVANREFSTAIGQVIALLSSKPSECAFSTATEVGKLARVNPGTVVRATQFLGFTGWPEFIVDYRGQYLASLSASMEVGSPAASYSRPRSIISEYAQSLEALAETVEESALKKAGELLLDARRIVVLATGSFAAPAHLLAYNCQLLGLDIDLYSGSPTAQLNAVKRLGPDDLLVTFNLWKYSTVLDTLSDIASESDVPKLVISDRTIDSISNAQGVILVPVSSNRLLASTIPTTAVIQAVIDAVARSRESAVRDELEQVDEWWNRLGLFD